MNALYALVVLAGILLALNILQYRVNRRAYEDGRARGDKEGYERGIKEEHERWVKKVRARIASDPELLERVRKGKPPWGGPPEPLGHGSTVSDIPGSD